jgi:peptidylprolyl isomerase
MKSRKIAFVFFLLSGVVANAQIVDEILLLQDSRSLNDGKLYGYLHSFDVSERARAALALANIQDTTSIPFLLPSLNDSSAIVRRMAAFALGQIGSAKGAAHLFSRIPDEADPECLKEIIDAIGKCGGREELRALALEAGSLPLAFRSSIALSVARFAYRGVKDSVASEYVVDLLGDSLSAAMATYGVMRIGDSTLVKRHLSAFIANLEHRSPELRMWTATILGIVSDSAALSALVDRCRHDVDWRVRVNAVRALKKYPAALARPALLTLIVDANEHVSLAAHSVLNASVERYASEDLIQMERRIISDSLHFSWRQRGEAAVFIAQQLKEKSIPALVRYLNEPPPLRSKIISALGGTGSAAVISYLQKELARKESAPVSAAIEAYEKVVVDKDSTTQSAFCRDILPLLERRDIGVSYSVAVAFQDTAIRASIRRQFIPQLIAAFQRLKAPDDVEPMVQFINLFADLNAGEAIPLLLKVLHNTERAVAGSAAKALQKMTGKNYEGEFSQPSGVSSVFKKDELQYLRRFHSAIVATSKGNFRIEFRGDAAPFTVLNFIVLVRKHFYDGLTFHRVVPNFVVQGGDPLATGFGGPGYAIRTEIHPDALYREGAVGMASAGKDTEGSQFFVTQCPTPHLDGRYTVFGYTKDLDIIDKIQIGDTIISVKLME